MNTTFQVWLKRDGCSPEFEYFCMAETPNQAFMMGATDPHHIDWINLESRPYLVISEFRNNLHIIWHWRNNQWVIERSLQLPNEVIPVNLEAIEKWVKIIGNGSNWVTDKYIVNLCDNLTNYEKYLLLCHLANMGFLYDGDKEYTDEEIEEDIQKGQKAAIGETRIWNGKKYKKQANGKWLEVSESGHTKREHERFHKEAEDDKKKPSNKGEINQTAISEASEYHKRVSSKLSDKEHSYISTKEKPPAGSILGINNVIHEERFKFLKEKSNG